MKKAASSRRSRPSKGEAAVGDSDRALKYLLHKRPAEFSRFALNQPELSVLRPVEAALPSRGRREVDGGYLILVGGQQRVSHTEFHRRHQSVAELALDVGEAQLRLFRREGLPVLSHVWDLYGDVNGEVLEDCELWVGPGPGGTRVAYRRVNLRALPLDRFLEAVPPPLWPLAPLARDGATPEAIVRVRDAIEAQNELSPAERTDRLAVLRQMAEIEGVSSAMLDEYFDEDRLMQSTFYQRALQKGRTEGVKEGKAEGVKEGKAEGVKENIKRTLTRVLGRRLGYIDQKVQARIEAENNLAMLEAWEEEALGALDEAAAQRLAEQIRKAPASQG